MKIDAAVLDEAQEQYRMTVDYFLKQRSGGYTWDPRNGRYISNWTGKPVKDATVRRAVRGGHEYLRKKVNGHTQRMLDGRMTVGQWQVAMAKDLKQAWAASMRVGGGTTMTSRQKGLLGSRLRQEYRYLNRFANQIAAGNLTEGQIMMRVDMYSDAAMVAYHLGNNDAKRQAGYREAKRNLGDADHCDDCKSLEGIWMPVDRIPVPGEATVCKRRCKCWLSYR